LLATSKAELIFNHTIDGLAFSLHA